MPLNKKLKSRFVPLLLEKVQCVTWLPDYVRVMTALSCTTGYQIWYWYGRVSSTSGYPPWVPIWYPKTRDLVPHSSFRTCHHALVFANKAPNLYTILKLRHRSFMDTREKDGLKHIVATTALVTQNEIFRNFRKS